MDSPRNTWRDEIDWANRIGCPLGGLLALLLVAGCVSSDARTSRSHIAGALQERTCHDIPAQSYPGDVLLPPEVTLEDGLSEEEAVAIALWNNSAFHATLSQVGMARGDIVQAGLLTNPQFFYLFGGGDKQIEYALFLPVEAMFLRKHRITIAEREFCRISQELVQNGLNVTRDVRVAYADLVFAIERSALADEALAVRTNIANLSEKRFEAGDIAQAEAMTARIDARRAAVDAAGLKEEIAIARERLNNLLGIGLLDLELLPSDRHHSIPVELDPQVLLTDALVSRPDLRAAQYAIAAADQQAGLSRWAWLRFEAIVDGNARGSGATNIGPGIRFDIPIFNRNQGGIIRSDWTTDQALHNFDAVQDQVVMEVRTAVAQFRQANVSLGILQDEVLPSLQQAIVVAENAYRSGGETYFLTLQTTSQYLDAHARELELMAAEHRALAELERSVGRRVASPVAIEQPEPTEEPQIVPAPALEPNKLQDGEVAFGSVSNHNAASTELFPFNLIDTNLQVAGTADECPLRQCSAFDRQRAVRSFTSLATDDDWPTDPRWVPIGESAVRTTGVDGIPWMSAEQ